MDSVEFDIGAPLVPKITQVAAPERAISPIAKSGTPVTKNAIRTSLRASTIDSAFAALYTITTSGILPKIWVKAPSWKDGFIFYYIVLSAIFRDKI
ncbi:hypothetical protein OGM63_14800 [Plectonema radiosum NIES-515]|uniref:Uncharacterized protein n=1 Tax=Plectonema radiosum NIES-515 TaxID=2986073 RepID=A0ABT3B062_9CYAN|nr:hypothetical protein [Plectonema radiosum]MCV3214771.1 hypothetical protein [Plectonema radiosum NIES-515]